MPIIRRIIRVIRRDGWLGSIKSVDRRLHLKIKCIILALSPIAIPAAAIILMISPWIRIRLLMLFSNHIGHYAWNTEFWLCAFDMRKKNEKRDKTFFYVLPGHPICNTQLHRMWKRTICILPFPYLMAIIDNYLMWFSHRYRNDAFKNFFKPGGRSWDAWNLLGKIKEPHLQFTLDEKQKGIKLLKALGIPEGAPYICLLGRDSRYLEIQMPNQNSSYNDYRNVDINSYQKAAEFLATQGYYVIRMGKYVKDRFQVNHPHVIDYANSPLRSDFGDIYLGAHCFFFMSVATGLDALAQLFRKPTLQTNVPCFDSWLDPNWMFFIPKKVLNLNTGKYLTSKEIAEAFPYDKTDKGRLMPQILQEKKLQMVDNTSEEILAVVKEMLDHVTGTSLISEEDELLQQDYWEKFKDPGVTLLSTTPPELTVPTLKIPVLEKNNLESNRKMGRVRLRIGSDFLRENKSWLN